MRYGLLGLALGLAAGLYFAWAVVPVEYVDTAPRSLRSDFRDDYLALIASAYSATGDLTRARARLALFPDLEPIDDLGALAQQRLAAGLPQQEVEALAELALSLAQFPQPVASPTPAPTVSPTPRLTLAPTARPSPTVSPDFELAARVQVCDPLLIQPLIQVEVYDAQGEPLRGAEVLVIWDEGEDRFFTGLKPELGEAYGDFAMSPATVYSVRLVDVSETVSGLDPYFCEPEEASQAAYLGTWFLRFEGSP